MGSRPRQVGIVRGREAVGDLGAGASRGNAHHRPGRGHVPFGPGCRGKGGTSFHGDGKHADSGRASHVGDVACEEGDGDGRRWHRCRRPPPTDAETCALRGLSLHVVGTNNGATGVRIPIWVAPHVLQHRTCEHRRPSPGIARHASRRPPVGTSATGPAARQGRKQRICPLWDETGQCGRPASRWPCNPPEAARAGLRAPSGPMVSTHLVRQEKSSFSSTDIEEIQQ